MARGTAPSAAEIDAEVERLLAFAEAARRPGGFASLDACGREVVGSPMELWVTCRMTHVFGLASILEPLAEGSSELLDHGVEALLGPWWDEHSGGWFATLGDDTSPDDDRKDGYAHAFVVLAGATATAAGHPRGRELLERALLVLRDRFWEEEYGMIADAWDRGFTTCDDYRGLNANMHAVEALLAAHDVTQDPWALEAADRIAGRVVHDLGPSFEWRLPEHFDPQWVPRPEFGSSNPGDPFRPYGVTIGHLLEWARLLVHLYVAFDDPARADLLSAAAHLGSVARRDGWAVDGRDGFVYTVGFDGQPVVRERMHWVVAEAIAQAAVQLAAGLDDRAGEDLATWLAFAWDHHRDEAGGSWWHELDAGLQPSSRVWPGKPDVYHAVQSLWLARWATHVPPVASFAGLALAVRAKSCARSSVRQARDALLTKSGPSTEFTWPDVGDYFNWAHDWFDPMARDNHASALVVVSDGQTRRWTFDELRSMSDQAAHALAEHGIARGSSVVVMLGNQVELWVSMLALMKVGAVIVPTASSITAEELGDRVRRGGAGLLLCNQEDVHRFAGADLPPALVAAELLDARGRDPRPVPHPGNRSDDRLLLYFTSGTTSRPKMVEHTHVSYPVGHLTTMAWLGLRQGDVHLNISSPGWAKHAYSMFFAPWLAEATVLAFDYARFDAAQLLGLLTEHEVTSFCAPPTVWRMLIKADLGARPPKLRELMSAGEPLSAEVIAHVRSRWGLEIRDGYGQTETTLLIGTLPHDEVRPGSMGRVLPGVPVVLVDPVSGKRVEREGEVCLDLSTRPVNLMTGYQDDPVRNSEAMDGGYYHTGDLAVRDADGYITFVGRTDDVFKSSDYKVSPFELESVLMEHPAVLEAAVVPMPDALRLAVPKAYVSVAPGHEPDPRTAAEILDHARARLPHYLRIRALEFADLPKTSSGKIRRRELRDRESSLADAGEPRPAQEFRPGDDMGKVRG